MNELHNIIVELRRANKYILWCEMYNITYCNKCNIKYSNSGNIFSENYNTCQPANILVAFKSCFVLCKI